MHRLSLIQLGVAVAAADFAAFEGRFAFSTKAKALADGPQRQVAIKLGIEVLDV
ncbi:MAG: hypothetical protein HY701_07625 [Gemmatimonadetes bacterium]|nr:hypothetical protein [Gemmatimonadota bacterium]